MKNQKRFLTVMLVVFVVVSSLSITAMAMLFEGMKQLCNLNLTYTIDLIADSADVADILNEKSTSRSVLELLKYGEENQ